MRTDMQQLRHGIEMLERTWNPVQRVKVLADLEACREVLTPAILEVLEDSRHSLRSDVVPLAGELRIAEARPALIEIVSAGSEPLVAPALRAAEAIAPWIRGALAELLHDGTRAQRLAVLALCRERDERPIQAIESLLDFDDEAIQTAALAALPTQLSDSALSQCIRLAEHSSLGASARVVLDRSRLTPAQAEMIADRAFAWSEPTQLAVLGGCGGLGGAIETVAWRLAGSGDPAVRVQALELLDRRENADVERVRRVMLGLPERGQYLAARCLVRGGDRTGLQILLDLASDESGDSEARLAARVTLEELSRISTAAGIGAWRRWQEQVADPGALQLHGSPFR